MIASMSPGLLVQDTTAKKAAVEGDGERGGERETEMEGGRGTRPSAAQRRSPTSRARVVAWSGHPRDLTDFAVMYYPLAVKVVAPAPTPRMAQRDRPGRSTPRTRRAEPTVDRGLYRVGRACLVPALRLVTQGRASRGRL